MRLTQKHKKTYVFSFLSSFGKHPYLLEKALIKTLEHIEEFYKLDGKEIVDSVIEYFNHYLNHYYKDLFEDFNELFSDN